MAEGEGVRFREVQRMRCVVSWKRWLFGIFLPVSVAYLAWAVWSLSSYLHPIRGWDMAFVGLFTLSHTGLILLWLMLRDETEVRDDAVYLRDDFPIWFGFRKIPLEHVVRIDVRNCELDHYKPTLGGNWKSEEGKGYFLYGKEGVRIDYADGSHVLIGSQRAEELAEAIRTLLEEKGEMEEQDG